MSDLLPELPRPPRPLSWRERVTEWAETLDLTPARLLVGTVAVIVVGFLGWKLLAPPPPPPEMRLPFVSTTAPSVVDDASNADSDDTAGTDSAGPGSGQESDEVVVHVAGAVGAPGVQHLAAGSRVVDAVEAAGGASPEADLGRVNLAALLEDGQQVYVPLLGEEAVPTVGPDADSSAGGAESGAASDGAAAPDNPVDLNRAGVDELQTLPGIGPALAQAIVDHRAQHGRFTSVDQLVEVRGIGEAKLEQLRALVTVG